MEKNQTLGIWLRLLFIVLISSGTLVLSSHLTPDEDLDMVKLHEEWMVKHGRVYHSVQEKEMRFQVFKESFKYVEAHNKVEGRMFNMSLNKFADITHDELFSKVISEPKPNSLYRETYLHQNLSVANNFRAAPAKVDWRKEGAVIHVQDQSLQAQCGSCWAFSTVAAVEGITKIKNGKLLDLSEQQLIDCVDGEGCAGGDLADAFEWIIQNKGITTEQAYPYKSKDATCDREAAPHAATNISDYQRVMPPRETALELVVANQPVSVAIDAKNFKFYQGGIFKFNCSTNLNHGMTVVGYDTSPDGTKYWILKNSWGTDWGEDGYMRIAKGFTPKGLCGLATKAYYPVV